MEDKEQKLVELKRTREHYRTLAFRMMLEIAFIFGIPAIIGYLLGQRYGYQIPILVFTFVISWGIMVSRYRSLRRKLKEVDEAIKREKES